MASVEKAAGGRVRIERGVSRDAPDEKTLPEDGRVENVCKKWLVHEDGAIAHKLQQEEFKEHFGINRKTRRTVRDDIQVSKFVQSEEEMQAQEDRLRKLEELNRMAEEDARVAKQIEEENQRLAYDEGMRLRQKEHDDEELASQYQEYLMRREKDLLRRRLTEDELLAREISDKLQTERTHDENAELTDEELARKLQRKEEERYERRKREWELKKERRRIEKAIAQHSTEMGIQMPSAQRHDEADAGSPSPRTVEDTGDFSDFYVKPEKPLGRDEQMRLQEQQDMEIARLLQEQEHKRRGGAPAGAAAANPAQDKMKQIEEQDAELARIIQEQEKLKIKKLRQKHKHRSDEHAAGSSLPVGHSAESDSASGGAPSLERRPTTEDTRVPSAGDHVAIEHRALPSLPTGPHGDDLNSRPLSQSSPREPSTFSFNIAEAIDPTFRRSRASHSPPLERAPPVPAQTGPPHPIDQGMGTRSHQEVWNPQQQQDDQYNHDDEVLDDQAIAPVQGMRRSPGDKKGKKSSGSGKRSSCKQQ